MRVGRMAAAAWMLAGMVSFFAVGESAAQALPGSARLQLVAVQNALVADDRPAFEERLGVLRSSPEAKASGLAQELLPLYELALRLWEVQFTTAFFAENSDLHAEVSQVRGFSEALRGSVVTDANGRRYFGAREARQFLARTAGQRLGQAGIRTVVAATPSRTGSAATAAPPRSGKSGATSGSRTRRIRRAKD
ncbi:MAG: hypothetical protein WA208_19420 [Thermoanaerobaculia bacterium]